MVNLLVAKGFQISKLVKDYTAELESDDPLSTIAFAQEKADFGGWVGWLVGLFGLF